MCLLGRIFLCFEIQTDVVLGVTQQQSTCSIFGSPYQPELSLYSG